MRKKIKSKYYKCYDASKIACLGMTFWELSSRKILFQDAANSSLIKEWIKAGEREDITVETPAGFAMLIGRC